MDKFVVKLKRHSSSYETDQGEKFRKVFIDRCQNSRSTCPLVEEQPYASGAIGSDDVSANPQNTFRRIPDFGEYLISANTWYCQSQRWDPWYVGKISSINWKKAKEDYKSHQTRQYHQFRTETFDAFLKLCKMKET